MGSASGFFNGGGDLFGGGGFAHIDEDKAVADGIGEVGGIEFDGLFAHFDGVVVLLGIARIEIGGHRVGRGELRVHLDDCIEGGEGVCRSRSGGHGTGADHRGHVVGKIVGRILRDGFGEFVEGGLVILIGIPGEEAEDFVNDGRMGIGGQGFIEGSFGFSGALIIDEEHGAAGLRFSEGQGAAGVGLGIIVDGEFE